MQSRRKEGATKEENGSEMQRGKARAARKDSLVEGLDGNESATRAHQLPQPVIMVPTPSSVSSSISSECGWRPSMMCVALTPWLSDRMQQSTCGAWEGQLG